MKRRVLIVDDIEENRYMLRALLEGHGYEVSEARNGVQALTSARTERPDVVVTDLLMPEMDGFSLCRALTQEKALSDIPIVVYSATYTAPEDRDLVLDLGAAAFVIKPAEPEALAATIREAIERAPTRRDAPPEAGDDFYERYSKRLHTKLRSKVDQLATAGRVLEDYITRCEAILDASRDAIVATDADAAIRTWNYSAESMFGYTEAEALGQPLDMLVPPERVDEERRILRQVRERRQSIRFETLRLRKNGTQIEVVASISFLGPSIGVVCVMSDLTAIRQAAEENRKLEEKLAIAQRMETVGRLTGGVAHDFNNLLTVVLSHADLIEKAPDANAAQREGARQIREAGECAASLTRQLLAFGGRRASPPEIVALNGAIRTMEKMLRRLIGENIDLVVSLAPDLGNIEAAPTQIEQVILNLAVNARDAMPNGGRLRIETTNLFVDSAAHAANIPSGQYVVMAVIDSGVGMDEQTRSRAFDAFFTTKAPDRGTGLGLATVHDIVATSGGHIRVNSEPGQGTTFSIYWPRDHRSALRGGERSVLAAARARSETILLVEDEQSVRQLARQVLTRAGYRVLEAASGEEAVELAAPLDDPIDLLVTDLVLPDIPGLELAARLCARRPGLHVLVTSGYSDGVALDRMLGRRVFFLPKPFAIRELTSAVRTALDETPSNGREPRSSSSRGVE